MEESYDFLGKEKPLIKTEEELVSEVRSLNKTLENKYIIISTLERLLGKELTKKKPTEFIWTSDDEEISYWLSKKTKLTELHQEAEKEKSRLEKELDDQLKDYNYKLTGDNLEITVNVGLQITTQEEYSELVKKINKIKAYNNIGFLVINLDFKETKRLKFALAKQIAIVQYLLSKLYNNVKLKFLCKKKSEPEHKLKNLRKKKRKKKLLEESLKILEQMREKKKNEL